MPKIFPRFESAIAARMKAECERVPDPSHDFLHVQRVVALAAKLAREENANLDIVLPAAYLHDVVIISKRDPRRSQASRLSAEEASRFLTELGYQPELIPQIAHAIAAHSFSANIQAETIEAKVLQDADRLDGLGAIGILRCFSLGGQFGLPFYDSTDPFMAGPAARAPNDQLNTLDHFYTKLLKLEAKLQTSSGQREGRRRTKYLREFMQQLASELPEPAQTERPQHVL